MHYLFIFIYTVASGKHCAGPVFEIVGCFADNYVYPDLTGEATSWIGMTQDVCFHQCQQGVSECTTLISEVD